ncbi:MAG: hypothetical protein HY329_14635 [Chloroflexi bacterium]|nr:hypothetical protein [Chloroflexota bacterium]
MQRVETRPAWEALRNVLAELVRRQAALEPEDYATFFVSGEGRELPTSILGPAIEESSGYLIDSRGRVYSFWIGWDADLGQPTLTRWQEVTPEDHWSRVGEYRRARELMGLDS